METNKNRIQNLESLKNIVPNDINFQRKKTSLAVQEIINNENINFENWNTDLTREIMLAKIFWLDNNKIKKLSQDYQKNITLTDIIQQAESYWNYRKTNESIYAMAA